MTEFQHSGSFRAARCVQDKKVCEKQAGLAVIVDLRQVACNRDVEDCRLRYNMEGIAAFINFLCFLPPLIKRMAREQPYLLIRNFSFAYAFYKIAAIIKSKWIEWRLKYLHTESTTSMCIASIEPIQQATYNKVMQGIHLPSKPLLLQFQKLQNNGQRSCRRVSATPCAGTIYSANEERL